MKQLILLMTLCIGTCVSSNIEALCLDGFYVSGSTGANFKPNRKLHQEIMLKYRTGYYLSAALGYQWKCVRFEGEYVYRHNQFKHLKVQYFALDLDGHCQTESYLGNGYYDFCIPNCFDIQPYVGLGLGYARTSVKMKHNHQGRFFGESKGFAWQAIAGLACPMNEHIVICFEYRFFDTRDKKGYNHMAGTQLRLRY